MTLDLTTLAAQCSVVPSRSVDPAVVRDGMFRDGAAVLSRCEPTIEAASGLAHHVLGAALLATGHPIEVTDGGGQDPRRNVDAARRLLPLHTDGFAYGAHAPDVFFLLCTTPSSGDGLSFLVDQVKLVQLLEHEADGRELADFVRTHPVDQTEVGGTPSIGPIALPLPSGQSAIRRSIDVHPTADDPHPDYTARMLTLWQGLLDGIGALATRFALTSGDAIAIDNTRLAHGRDAYTNAGRSMWRCWAWTARSGGAPSGELWSDTRMVLAG